MAYPTLLSPPQNRCKNYKSTSLCWTELSLHGSAGDSSLGQEKCFSGKLALGTETCFLFSL